MLRPILRLATRCAPSIPVRPLHVTRSVLATKPAHEPASTQGHTTQKSKDPVHQDSDVQSASTRAGRDARNVAETKSSGEDEPFDAARQGNTGGEVKGSGAQGPFKDQVGGQDEPQKGTGVKMGKAEEASATGIGGMMKQGMDSVKQMTSNVKSYHTSARRLAEPGSTTPRTDPDGARLPKDKDVQGDQNQHLKHTEGGSQGKEGSGNASPDPHLPSKSSSKAQQARSFSTSVRVMADPNTPSADAPRSAEQESQKQQGLKQQPRGEVTEQGGAAGDPTRGETAAPDPGLPKGVKEGATKSGMGVRNFSTSMKRLADPNTPSADPPRPTQKDAQNQAGLKQQPRGSDTEHGGHQGGPTRGDTAAPDPGIPKSEKEGAVKGGMTRKFSTSARRAVNSKAPSGFAKALEPEPVTTSGYHAPPEALPPNLKSAYQEKDPNAVHRPPSGLTSKLETGHSSTAVDPPNEALRQSALDGSFPEKNPQPQAEFGRQGLGEAWKNRK